MKGATNWLLFFLSLFAVWYLEDDHKGAYESQYAHNPVNDGVVDEEVDGAAHHCIHKDYDHDFCSWAHSTTPLIVPDVDAQS